MGRLERQGVSPARLDGNGIAYIYPRAFRGLANLSVLQLDRNAVHFLPDDVFDDLGRLAELRLADNELEHVWARTFRGLRSLRSLRLTSNRLAHLPAGVFGDSPAGDGAPAGRGVRRLAGPPARSARPQPALGRRTLYAGRVSRPAAHPSVPATDSTSATAGREPAALRLPDDVAARRRPQSVWNVLDDRPPCCSALSSVSS